MLPISGRLLKTETIISKDNKRHIINRIKCEGRRDRRRNGPAKHATKSRRVRIDGGRCMHG